MVQYLGIESKVDLIKERDAIVEFLNNYWDINVLNKSKVENLGEIVSYILESGVKYGIGYQEKQLQPIIQGYNRICGLTGNDEDKADFQLTVTEEKFDLENKIKIVQKAIIKDNIFHVEPKEYNKCRESKFYLKPKEKLVFNGSTLPDSILVGVCDLPTVLCKEEVFFYENTQNRSPASNLIGAILRQGIGIGYDLVEQKWGTDSSYINKIFIMVNNKI